MMINWKRIRLENFIIPHVIGYNGDYLNIDEGLPKEVSLKKITESTNEEVSRYLSSNIQGVDRNLVSHGEENYNSGITLYIPKNTRIQNL